MKEALVKTEKKNICIGLLAHVDSGKTTLSEAMLYTAGEISKPGRVDHGDSFLDTDAQERNRGITIFSKQAVMDFGGTHFTLLDTPGHVDFSAEMERTLSVLDAAVLVVSARDGLKSHTETLWRLLKANGIPTFIFVNKMDLAVREKEDILETLRKGLDSAIADFSALAKGPEGSLPDGFLDEVTLCSEGLAEKVLEGAVLSDEDIIREIRARKLFPCYFGSALKIEGIEELLAGLDRFIGDPYAGPPLSPLRGQLSPKGEPRSHESGQALASPLRGEVPQRGGEGDSFGGRVFKIARGDDGARLTFLKVTSGTLAVRDSLSGKDREGNTWEEKINQIRIYSGMKYKAVDAAAPGQVVAVTGLTHTLPGDGLGREKGRKEEFIEPFLTYTVLPEAGVDDHTALQKLSQLSEEDPKLRIRWNEQNGHIEISMMGEVQPEILKNQIRDRFGFEVEFGDEQIVYKETIADTVEGVGHFEPLRHYSEVHLLMEPGEPGSGLVFSSICPEDELDKNWQRLILTHLMEREHPGVLTGAPITDMKISLAAGRAHKKHTEGGDFRQSTYRAIRNGLMKAECVLLEPWFDFTIQLPAENVGRAMSDVQRMKGTFGEPDSDGETAVLKGRCPASEMKGYQTVLAGYTKGRGNISCVLDGYGPCHNQDEVVLASGYDPERDIENPADSVFCYHGESGIVPWYEVEEHMHLPSVLDGRGGLTKESDESLMEKARAYRQVMASDKELMKIFERTYGPVKDRREIGPKVIRAGAKSSDKSAQALRKQFEAEKADPGKTRQAYLFVDGYNVMNSWPELKELARTDYGAARDQLVDILRNYQGFTGEKVTLVFDAYRVEGGTGSRTKIPNIEVVYTKENETADSYIEKATLGLAKKHRVRVVTSDDLVQKITFGHGALRCSSREFREEVRLIEESIRRVIEEAGS